MKKIALFEKVSKLIAGLKFDYLNEDDSELGSVDFGVLTVAMMVAALDGTIQDVELKALSKLARKCRVNDAEFAHRYESALRSAGYILLSVRSGITQKAVVEKFVREAGLVLPKGFAGGRIEDIRRALVLWIMMGLADGEFCGIERACVTAFCQKVVDIMKARRECRREKLWVGLCSGVSDGESDKTDIAAANCDLMKKAEQAVLTGDSAIIRAFILKG